MERSRYRELRKAPTLKKLLGGAEDEQSELFGLAVQFVYDAKTYEGVYVAGEPQGELTYGVLLPELAKKGRLSADAMASFVQKMVPLAAHLHQYFPVAAILDRIADEDVDVPVAVIEKAKLAIDVDKLNDERKRVPGMSFDGSSNTGIRLGLWLRRRGVDVPLLRGHYQPRIRELLDASNAVIAEPALEPLAHVMALATKPKAGKAQVAAARGVIERVPADQLAVAAPRCTASSRCARPPSRRCGRRP